MFTRHSLLPSILLALSLSSSLSSVSVSASPAFHFKVDASLITLPIASKFKLDGTLHLADLDRLRAAFFKQTSPDDKAGKRQQSKSIPVANSGITYTTDVGIGSPPTTYTLLIDTGSSNTWIGAGKEYVKTRTSHNTNHSMSVSYGSGAVEGTEYEDTVALSPSLIIRNQSIGVASSTNGLDGMDGILGIGPVALTKGTVQDVPTIPTVIDNLHSQGTISQKVLGIYYAPITAKAPSSGGKISPQVNGAMTFGGVDTSKTRSEIKYTKVTSTMPAAKYWGIDQSITYGGSTPILSTSAGIVDTGTTLILLATDAFTKYKNATGATLDTNTGLLKITAAQYKKLKNLDFHVGGNVYSLTPNAQIWPRALNGAIGGEAGVVYLVVNDLGSKSGEGLDFINGYTFLERFYSVYDSAQGRIGFASTVHTGDTTN